MFLYCYCDLYLNKLKIKRPHKRLRLTSIDERFETRSKTLDSSHCFEKKMIILCDTNENVSGLK